MKTGIQKLLINGTLIASIIIAQTFPIFPSLPGIARAQESPTATSTPPEAPAQETSAATSTATVATTTQETSADPSVATSTENVATTTQAVATTTATTTLSSTATTTLDSTATTTLSSTGTSTPGTVVSGNATSTATSTAGTAGTASTADTSIKSGRAVAMANILNILNANIVNSDGRLVLSNFFDAYEGTLDFRPDGIGCAIYSCDGVDGIEVRLLSNAHIENAILLAASTGGNEIEGGGNASIETGDALTGLNLINIANTNFIDSQYLLVSVNAFQDVNGDIVFPGFSSFMNDSSMGASGNFNNQANIENDVDIDTDSGGNTTDSASSTIATGGALSSSNVFNQINTSLTGGHNVAILLRVHGDWVGEVFGAPEALERTGGTDSTLFLSNGTSAFQNGHASTSASSTALIKNKASLSALTGENSITGASTALISTGNAFAGANLINIANANVVGRNWVLAILNIFGNFKGNISFGRPDLWVGEQVNVRPGGASGSELEYKISVINNGDAEATNVTLSDVYDVERLVITGSPHKYSTAKDRTIEWSLGNIPPGGAKEVTYKARMRQPAAGIKMKNFVSVSSRETDNNTLDNTDTITVDIPAPAMSWGAPMIPSQVNAATINAATDTATGTRSAPLEVLVLARETPATIIKDTEQKVLQKLVLRNTGMEAVRSVFLTDTLYDPLGNALKKEDWKIGTVLPHEEVTLTYEITFGELAQPGVYTLTTNIRGVGTSTRMFPMNGAIELDITGRIEPVTASRLQPTVARTPARIQRDIVKEPATDLPDAPRAGGEMIETSLPAFMEDINVDCPSCAADKASKNRPFRRLLDSILNALYFVPFAHERFN